MSNELGGGLLGLMRMLGLGLLRMPRTVAWVPAVCWATGIWFLSAASAPIDPDAPSLVHYLANGAHAFEFGVLTLLLIPVMRRQEGWVIFDGSSVTTLCLVAIGYGLVDELHQSTVPGRTSSAFDLLTDWVGVYCTIKIAIYLGDPEATSRGLCLRLALGIFLCMIGAGFAQLDSS